MKIYIYDLNYDESVKKTTTIRIFGINEENKNVCLTIDNFKPYIYVELPTHIEWTTINRNAVRNALMNINHRKSGIVGKMEFTRRKKLYYASEKNNDVPYMKVYFDNKSFFYGIINKLKNHIFVNNIGNIKLSTHEQNANPILQLGSTQDLPMAGWCEFKYDDSVIQTDYTYCDYEFNISYKDIHRCDEDDIINDTLPQAKVMSFDLEVYSSNSNMFPNADKKSDVIFQISCIVWETGNLNKRQDYLLSLGNYEWSKPTNPDEQIDEKAIVYKYNNELELLLGFKDLMIYTNPNIITGYNIMNFDITYMLKRCEWYNNVDLLKQFSMMGMIKEKVCPVIVDSWSSSAFKNQQFEYLNLDGRLTIDLITLVKKNYRMANYKLQTVSTEFLGASKDPLTAKDIFRCYEKGILGGVEGGQALEMVGKYCIQDSVLVQRLFELFDTWAEITEASQVCNIPISLLLVKGQQIKVFSQVYKYCHDNDIVVEFNGYISDGREKYQGAIVLEPLAGLYEYVVPFDFASLYPTTIISYNIDYSTMVLDEEISDDLCHVIEWDEEVEIKKDTEELDIKEDDDPLLSSISQPPQTQTHEIVKMRYRFLRSPLGVIPTIIQNLLDARKKVRSRMKRETDKNILAVLNKRQLSYKISSNSMYGIMGTYKGYIPFMNGAMSVTAAARSNLLKAVDYLKTSYGAKIVYGDSVVGDTPILLKHNTTGLIQIKTIESIRSSRWKPYDEFKAGDSNRREKQQCTTGYKAWTSKGWSQIVRVIRHKTIKKIYRVNTEDGEVDVTEDHSLLNSDKEIIKPQECVVGETKLLTGFPTERKTLYIPPSVGGEKDDTESKLIRAIKYYQSRELLTPSSSASRGVIISVSVIHEKYEDWVYDLETLAGNFQAGVGNIIVKNTDSCYTTFEDVKREDLWEHANKIEQELWDNEIFPRPMKLEFEQEIYAKFLILTKKRYMWTNYERDGSIGKKIGKKGVLLARRDNSVFERMLYEEIVDLVFENKSKEYILEHISERMNQCCSHSLDVMNFIITTAIGDPKSYKKKPLPLDDVKKEKRLKHLKCDESEYEFRCLPAPIHLAQRMKNRGTWVDVGERIEYVVSGAHGDLLIDKLEDPKFCRDVDYMYYIKKLTKQLDQLISVVFKEEVNFGTKQYKIRLAKIKYLKEMLGFFVRTLIFVEEDVVKI